MKIPIQTRDAPESIGTYSQAVRAGDSVYLSGQIGFDPATMQMAANAVPNERPSIAGRRRGVLARRKSWPSGRSISLGRGSWFTRADEALE